MPPVAHYIDPAHLDSDRVVKQPHNALRLLSYNVQAGIETNSYREYLTRGWRHVLPSSDRMQNLDRIARVTQGYDIVGLQEVDGGSLRSGFVNQVHYLARAASMPFWYSQLNRDLGRLGQHSNGFMSRFRPTEIHEIRLPGLIPGRGALMIRFGEKPDTLVVVILHLALSKRAREKQLAVVCERLHGFEHVILMGDLNSRARDLENLASVRQANLFEPARGLKTFPSWDPHRCLDRILVSPTIEVDWVDTVKCTYSDHLPIALEARIPAAVNLSSEPDPAVAKTA